MSKESIVLRKILSNATNVSLKQLQRLTLNGIQGEGMSMIQNLVTNVPRHSQMEMAFPGIEEPTIKTRGTSVHNVSKYSIQKDI